MTFNAAGESNDFQEKFEFYSTYLFSVTPPENRANAGLKS